MATAIPRPTFVSALSYQEIGLSPRGACLLGADALVAGRVDIAERLVFALREKMLPEPERNPWDGPAGSFWSLGLRLDRVEWLRCSIGALPKEKAKDCARALLMQSAKSRAFESFEYLLSLGAARRSWKLLEAAYEAGGSGAAKKVKKPTALEAENLLRPHACRGKSLEDLAWCASFLAPDHRLDPGWIERLAQHAGDELAEACVRSASSLKLDLSEDRALIACARLAAQGCEGSALAAAELAEIKTGARFDEIQLMLNCGPHMRAPHAFKDISLMECATLGQCPRLCADLMSAGAKPPSAERLRSLLSTAPHWYRDSFASLFERVNAFREALELRLCVEQSPAPKTARARGL